MDKIQEAFNQYSHLTETDIKTGVASILDDRMEANKNGLVYQTILGCIDLTSLQTTDTEESIETLTQKVNQFEDAYPELTNVAGICVYPALVKTVHDTLTAGAEIVTVSAGFPHSQTFIEIKIAETSLSVMEGATEIDVVFPIGKLLEEKYEEIVEEIQEIKASCQNQKLKVILESGALSPELLRKAAILAMESGADFIKTSTGKQEPAATTSAAYLMCQMIREYHQQTGRKVGFKAAGGIVTTSDAMQYYSIVESILGEEWLTKECFRIGASRLANNLLSDIIGEKVNYF